MGEKKNNKIKILIFAIFLVIVLVSLLFIFSNKGNNNIEQYAKYMNEGNSKDLVEMINVDEFAKFSNNNLISKQILQQKCKNLFDKYIGSYKLNRTTKVEKKSDVEKTIGVSIDTDNWNKILNNVANNGYEIYVLEAEIILKDSGKSQEIKDIVVFDNNGKIISSYALSDMFDMSIKINDAKQKNDIGAAKDKVSLVASNAQMKAYDSSYGKNSKTNIGLVVSEAISNLDGDESGSAKISVKTIINEKGLENKSEDITQYAKITIKTNDFYVIGYIGKNGIIKWNDIKSNN